MIEHKERIGQKLGSYYLTRLLGQGSIADVYLGEHVRLKTQAAIKLWHHPLQSGDIERFRAEASRVARLDHPHIVPILEYNVEDTLPYLVMHYLANGTVRQQYARERPLPLATIVSFARQLADALAYAHSNNIIHGDIKPENMLLASRDQVLLSDFSMSSIAQNAYAHHSMDIAGIVAYMAPEQLHGQTTPASDQYALGVVMYEWLSGRLPFYGSFAEIATQHLIVPPPPLHTKIPAILPAVEEVVYRALEKDPRKRFQSVHDFIVALEQASQAEKPRTSSFGLPGDISLPAKLSANTPRKFTSFSSNLSSDSLKKYWQVIAFYDIDIKRNPHDSLAYSERGDAYYMLEEYERAILDYNYALALDSKCIPAYSNRGLAYSHLEEYRQAIADFTRAIELDANSVTTYYNRGNAYALLEDYKRAIADYDSALRRDDKHAFACYNRGNAYARRKEYEQAIADYSRVIELEPTYLLAYYNRGRAYSQRKNYAQAIEDYSRVIELDPHLEEAWYNRGLCYACTKEYEKAVLDYNRVLELAPDDHAAHINRALAYLYLKEHRRALVDLNRLIELGAGSETLYNYRGLAFLHIKDYEQAIENYTRAIEIAPNFAWAYANRGEAYHYVKDYKQALADLDRAVELDGEEALAYTSRGLTYFSLREHQRAIADFTRALEIEPEDYWSYSHRGLCYYRLKDYERAMQDCSKAIELNPLFGCAYDNRGMVYLAMDDLEEGREDILMGSKLTPEHISHGWSAEWSSMCLQRPDSEMAARLQALAEIDPQDYIAYICRAVALWIQGDFEAALAELEAAIPLELKEDAYFWKGIVCASLGRGEEAAAALKQALDWGGIPALLQAPLNWLKEDSPDFYEQHILPLL